MRSLNGRQEKGNHALFVSSTQRVGSEIIFERPKPRFCNRLSGNHEVAAVDMIDRLNHQLAGWAAFYKFTYFTSRTFQRIDTVVFWKLAHWLAQKYRSRIKPLMRKWYRVSAIGQSKTWLIYGRSNQGKAVGKALHRLVTTQKMRFRWRNPERNPYILRNELRNTVTSRYHEVAMAVGHG